MMFSRRPYMKKFKRRYDTTEFKPRAFLIVFGAIAAISGFYGFLHGHMLYGQYDAQLGTLSKSYTLWIGFIGLIMLIAGLIFRWE